MTERNMASTALTAEQVADFVGTAKVAEIAAWVAGLDDAALQRLITDRTRAATVAAIVNRLPDFVVDDRVLDVDAVVRFVVTDDAEAYDVAFRRGAITVGPRAETRPRVTIELAAVELARLVTGTTNAALAVLGGRLRVKGDEAFAAELASFFAVPGTDGPAVDPTALDAAEVARIVAKAKDHHLRGIMAGGFRRIVLEEVTRRFPDYLDPAKAGSLTTTVAWKVTGGLDGGVDRFLVRIADGRCVVLPEGTEAERDATITVDGVDFLKLVTGNLNPVLGVMRGRLKVSGDLAVAATLNSVMKPPSTR